MLWATTETPADVVRWLQSEAADLWPAILSSLSFRCTRCGYEHCRACLSGEQHASHVLYGQHNGRRFAVYVPEDLAPQLRRAVENGPAVQDLLVQAGPRYVKALKQVQSAHRSARKAERSRERRARDAFWDDAPTKRCA
jgi:hypothetical protein